MKKIILTTCAAVMLSIASFAQDTSSTNYNDRNRAVGEKGNQFREDRRARDRSPQSSQERTDESPSIRDQSNRDRSNQPQSDDQTNTNQNPSTQGQSSTDQQSTQGQGTPPTGATPPTTPTNDQSMEDGTNAIPQGQGREASGQGQPSQNQVPTSDREYQDGTHAAPLNRGAESSGQGQPRRQDAQSPTNDQSMEDGTNAIPQGQGREASGQGQPRRGQSDQAVERASDMVPVEDKEGPNGEAVFQENGKYFYMNEAGEKTKIKKSKLKDKSQ